MNVSNCPSGEAGNSFHQEYWEAEESAPFLVACSGSDFWRLFCLWKKLSAGGFCMGSCQPWWSSRSLTILCPQHWSLLRSQITVKGGQSFARGWSTVMTMKWSWDLHPASEILGGFGLLSAGSVQDSCKRKQLPPGAGVVSLYSGSCNFLFLVSINCSLST